MLDPARRRAHLSLKIAIHSFSWRRRTHGNPCRHHGCTVDHTAAYAFDPAVLPCPSGGRPCPNRLELHPSAAWRVEAPGSLFRKAPNAWDPSPVSERCHGNPAKCTKLSMTACGIIDPDATRTPFGQEPCELRTASMCCMASSRRMFPCIVRHAVDRLDASLHPLARPDLLRLPGSRFLSLYRS